MIKTIIFRRSMYECKIRRKELHLSYKECLMLSSTMTESHIQDKIKGYWKDVMVDETIKLDGLTKEGFQMFYI